VEQMHSKHISVVIPMLNEEENILPLLEEIESVFCDMPKVKYEVIVVDDGSTDCSVERVKTQLRNDSD